MWKIFIIIFGVFFGIFMPRSIYENYTDADLEDSTYEEDSYVNSEDSTYEEYSYADSEDSVYGDYPYPDPEYAAGRGNLKTYNNKDYDPTKTDWENYGDTGSIMEIADTDWALENAPVFHVETKEQLAGVVYYVNAVKGYNDSVELYLEADIDLDGLEWVPMGGWYRPDRYLEHTTFVGLIDGQNHIIKNMHIDTKYGGHCGFVGYSYSLQMKNITFEKAYVSGGTYVGIAGGEIYGSEDWINVNVSGMVGTPGPETGSIVGREAGINFRDCDATVVYKKENGRFGSIRYFSHRYQLIAETPVVEAFTLIYENGVITRDEVEGYDNLGWHIERDGSLLLDRAAEGELQLPAEYTYPDTSIWLEAYINGTYVRVSNIIEVP